MVIAGILFLIAGIAAGTRSGILESRASPDRRIELWFGVADRGRVKRSIFWQVVGSLLAIAGCLFLLSQWEIPLVFLVLLPSLAAVAVGTWHNHSVAKREPKA
jgi:hypothetical protein